MLLKQFKRTGPLTMLLIGIVLVIMWAGPIIRVSGKFSLYFDLDPMPLYGIVSSLTGTHPVPGILFSVTLVSLMAFLMVNLNTTLFFINERTFLPALFYILLSGLFPQYQLMNPAVFGGVFLMLAIKRIMDSYRIQGTSYSFFDAGLLIGTGSLFYANLIWFGLITIIGIILIRAWNPKEITLSLTGLIAPFALAIGFYYVIGKNPLDLLYLIDYNLFGRKAAFAFTPVIVVTAIYAGVLVLASLSHLFMIIGTKKIQSRKTFALLSWVMIISLSAWLLVPSISVEMIWIAAIPLSYFLSHYFTFLKKRLLPEILFSLFLLVIIFIQVWYLK
ncbi:MAG TPA: DUF6427 family protein [Bacteroidales bacterium]|nr:DUF6427 family protein [Bacteroidales bacterium]